METQPAGGASHLCSCVLEWRMEETLEKLGQRSSAGPGFLTFVHSPDLPLCFYSAVTDWIQDGPGPLGFRAGKWESRASSGGVLFMAVGKGDQR